MKKTEYHPVHPASSSRPEANESAIERAKAAGIDIQQLRAMLDLTPAERLNLAQLRTLPEQGAIRRAEAYGIDISLLRQALTWTPTQRLNKLENLVKAILALRKAGIKRHGIQAYPSRTDDLRG